MLLRPFAAPSIRASPLDLTKENPKASVSI
jgi:hypothetical protein